MNAVAQVRAAANAVVSSKTTSPHHSYPMEHKKLPHRRMFVHWFTPTHRPLPRLFRQRRVDRRTQDDCADALCPRRASARTQAHRLVVSAEHLFSADEIRVARRPNRANQLTRSHAHLRAYFPCGRIRDASQSAAGDGFGLARSPARRGLLIRSCL